MNLTISKEQIINGLQAVQNVVSTRTTLPILSNVLLRAEGDKLQLTATDLDVTITCGVEAKVKKPGASTVPVKKLFGIVRELTNLEIDLQVDEKNVCQIQSGPSFYKINGLSADEFPPLPKFKEDQKVTMVATDGRRLALVDEEVDVAENSQGEFIVPAKAVNELNRLLQDKGEVEVRYAENQASFTLKDEKGASILIVTKLIEGNYPNYRQVIPAETKERVGLAREEFLHALRRAEIMTSEKSNSVKMSFGKNKLEITANSPEVGEAK